MNSLLSKIRTIDERDSLNNEIDILLLNLYEHQGKGFSNALETQVRAWVSAEINRQLEGSIEETERFLKELKAELNKLNIIKLKISFEPTNSSIDKFYSFINKYRKDRLILEFEIDPLIFGGAEITCEGEYRDFSLKRLFESEFKEKEEELKSIVNRH